MPAQSTLRHTGVGMVALAALLAVLLAPRRRLFERLEHDSAPASADDRLNLVMSQPAERAGPGGGLQERKVDAPFGGVLVGARLMLWCFGTNAVACNVCPGFSTASRCAASFRSSS